MRTADVRARICHVGGFRQRYTDTESIGSLIPLLYHAPYNVGSLLSAQILAPVAVVDIILGYVVEEVYDYDLPTIMPGMGTRHASSCADWWIFYYDGEMSIFEQQQRLAAEARAAGPTAAAEVAAFFERDTSYKPYRGSGGSSGRSRSRSSCCCSSCSSSSSNSNSHDCFSRARPAPQARHARRDAVPGAALRCALCSSALRPCTLMMLSTKKQPRSVPVGRQRSGFRAFDA